MGYKQGGYQQHDDYDQMYYGGGIGSGQMPMPKP